MNPLRLDSRLRGNDEDTGSVEDDRSVAKSVLFRYNRGQNCEVLCAPQVERLLEIEANRSTQGVSEVFNPR